MGYKEQFEFWLEDSYFDEATKQELLAIRNDEKEIEDRFYKELAFGTGGLRGVIGAGTNRMNIYTVRKATQGLANYIRNRAAKRRVWRSLTIPGECPPSLRTRRLCASRPTALRLMCSTRFALRPNYPLRSASSAAFPAS